jgi:pilus assembly protein Flp/PilA
VEMSESIRTHPKLDPPPEVCIPETVDLAACHATDCSPRFHGFLRDDSGQDLVEYALLVALVGLSAITAIKGLSTHIGTSFSSVSSTLTSSV